MFKYYFVATLAILFGVYRIYKSTISFDKMTKIEGKVLHTNLDTTYGSFRTGRTAYYSLAIAINTINYKIGIPLSENYLNKAYYNSINKLFDTINTYKFYLNPLVLRNNNNVWCGICKVEQSSKVIYERKGNNDIIWGVTIIIVTLIAIIWITIKFDPINDSNFWINFRNGNLRPNL